MNARRTVVLLAFAAAACGGASRRTTAGRDNTFITADEIARIDVPNAYEVIRRLRPEFLVSRGLTRVSDSRPAGPTVYLDGTRYGDVSTLQGIDAARIASIRFLSASEAKLRLGADGLDGAIVVTTKR